MLSSSPVISPFPGPVNQSSNRRDLDLHSSDVQHLPSGTDMPTGQESWAAETSSRAHRAQITASLGNQCRRFRGWLCALIRTPHSCREAWAHQVLRSGRVTEALLAGSVCVTGPSSLLSLQQAQHQSNSELESWPGAERASICICAEAEFVIF